MGHEDQLYDLDKDGIYDKDDGIQVTYDIKLGYPVKGELNPNIPDADIELTISHFEVTE